MSISIKCARHVCPQCQGAKDFYAKACRACSRRPPIKDRIREKIELDPDTGCWLWTGKIGRTGDVVRGYLSINNRTTLAYRASYEAFIGPIPEGLELDHLCRRPLCVNPKHLEPVTHAENQRRGRGSVTHCIRGHAFDDKNTVILHNKALGKTQRTCRICLNARAKDYNKLRRRALKLQKPRFLI